MADPIEELIAQNVKTTALTVTTDNDYNESVNEVYRLTSVEGFNAIHLNVVILEDPPERDREAESAGSHTWRKVFGLALYFRPSDEDESPQDTGINRFRADMAKAMMIDHTRGGYAMDTDILDPAVMTDENGVVQGCLLPIEVSYRTLETDPYTQA